jgi:hypothetical protein
MRSAMLGAALTAGALVVLGASAVGAEPAKKNLA